MWLRFAELHTGVWVVRVPTEVNIADLPSREKYDLMKGLGAKKVSAFLSDAFKDAQAWQSLAIKQSPMLQ